MVSTKREFSVAWFSDGVSLEEQRNTVPKTALLQKPCFTLPVATSGCQGVGSFHPDHFDFSEKQLDPLRETKEAHSGLNLSCRKCR
jgi:hypothetical protein